MLEKYLPKKETFKNPLENRKYRSLNVQTFLLKTPMIKPNTCYKYI